MEFPNTLSLAGSSREVTYTSTALEAFALNVGRRRGLVLDRNSGECTHERFEASDHMSRRRVP